MSTGSSRWLAGIGALVIVLIVASVLIAVLGDGNSVREFPADSPEGVVQGYLRAVMEKDAALALGFMEGDARNGCTVQEVTQQTQYFTDSSSRRRIVVSETRELSDGRVQVEVQVTEVNVSPPFDIREYTFSHHYTLVDEDGDWVIEYPGWPVNFCRAVEDARRAAS